MCDVIVKMKNGMINTKKKTLIFLEARMCLPVIQSHAPQHIQKVNVKTKELLFSFTNIFPGFR